jgi:hypothetical protein
MGQTAHPAQRRRPAAALVAVLATVVAGVGLTGCGSSLAAAATSLAGVLDARVVHADGSTVAGVGGLRLHPGDVVRTGPAGRAELVTRSRIVYLGSDASVQVLDGGRQVVRHGAVVVDAQRGPALSLQVADLVVVVGHGSAVRAERSVADRIATLVGAAAVESATGRRLTVPALAQVVVGADALPDGTTPLRLTDDDAEAHAAPALVRDDLALVALAAGLDSTGSAPVRAVTAAWHAPLAASPAGLATSEQILPVVIAAAGGADGRVARYARALELRAAGGSWAVVTRLVGVATDAVLGTFAEWESGGPAGLVGDVTAAVRTLAATGAGPGASGPGSTGSGNGGGTGGGGAGGGSGGGGTGGGSGGGSHPTPSPTPSPINQAVETVTGTVGSILSVLPTASPSPVLGVTVPGGTNGGGGLLTSPLPTVLGH